MVSPCLISAQGGETLALKRLEEHMADKAWVVQFEKPRGNPAALEPATTVLSPFLKFGCLSVRVFYQRLQQVGIHYVLMLLCGSAVQHKALLFVWVCVCVQTIVHPAAELWATCSRVRGLPVGTSCEYLRA